MLRQSLPPHADPERGGITILVALMLLVLLTIAAVGMSKNSFREVIISASSRQGAMTRNVADSGIEWSIYWMDLANSANASGSAVNLNKVKLALLNDDTLSGRAWDVMSSDPISPTSYVPGANATVTLDPVTTAGGTVMAQSFSAGLTRMGKLPVTDMSQGVGSGSFTPATGSETKQAPDLWAIRTDAQVSAGPSSFVHAKEVWVSTAVQ